MNGGWRQEGEVLMCSLPQQPSWFLIMLAMNTDLPRLGVCEWECINFHATRGQRAHLLHCDCNRRMHTHTHTHTRTHTLSNYSSQWSSSAHTITFSHTSSVSPSISVSIIHTHTHRVSYSTKHTLSPSISNTHLSYKFFITSPTDWPPTKVSEYLGGCRAQQWKTDPDNTQCHHCCQ